VRLLARLEVGEQPDYLPVAVASTCFAVPQERYNQAIYRAAAVGGEGCIEIRCLPVNGLKGWSTWESVTEEDGLLGGICWSLLTSGYITIAMVSRIYFFSGDAHLGEMKAVHWTTGRKCLIFEVDVYLERFLPAQTQYATRLLSSDEKTASILVFASQKSRLQSFKLELCPSEQRVRLCAKTELVEWKLGARSALLAWSMSRKLMTGHCCEDECEKRDEIPVLKTWFARGEKQSLKHLVWEYGGVVVDYWDK
jgi:hypothetical protein